MFRRSWLFHRAEARPALRPRLGAGGAVALAALVAATACGGSASSSSATPAPSAPVATASAARTPRGFGNRTPRPEIETAIAEGTAPAGGFRGAGGGVRPITLMASLLSIDETQIRSELEAPGATIASVAAAHGLARDDLRKALIDATRQRLADAVASGAIQQSQAAAIAAQFEAGVDRVLDGSGGAVPGPTGTAP